MPEKIEVSPFINWDIRDLVMKTDIVQGQIKKGDAAKTADLIIEKVTAFVNENYIPKA